MKRILAPILLLTLLFSSLAFGETQDDLIFRPSNGLVYKKYTEVPFTGKLTGKNQGSFRNGMRVGLWFHYHRDGWLYSKGISKDGKKHGPWVRHRYNGHLMSKGTYKDGKKHGPWFRYRYNGQLMGKGTYKVSKETYKNGVKVSD